MINFHHIALTYDVKPIYDMLISTLFVAHKDALKHLRFEVTMVRYSMKIQRRLPSGFYRMGTSQKFTYYGNIDTKSFNLIIEGLVNTIEHVRMLPSLPHYLLSPPL